jgi:hypothetical protein
MRRFACLIGRVLSDSVVFVRRRGSALTEIEVELPRRLATVRTDEDSIALLRRLATHYPDAVIAGILNRREPRTAYGHRFTANLVGYLRRHWNIACFDRPTNPPTGELLNIKQIANALGVAASTVHRWLNDGIIAGEQIIPGPRGAFAQPTNCALVSPREHRRGSSLCIKPSVY